MTAWISSLRSRLHTTRWWKHLKLFIEFTILHTAGGYGFLLIIGYTFPAQDYGPKIPYSAGDARLFVDLLFIFVVLVSGWVLIPVLVLLKEIQFFEMLGVHSLSVRAAFIVLISAAISTWVVAFISSRIRKPPPVVPDADEASKP